MVKEKINTYFTKIKEKYNKQINFIKQKKVINIILIVILLGVLIGSSWIRVQNLPLLKDQTTGKYIPAALDPFYFLRVAETIVENNGLPDVDVMRYPSAQIAFLPEITPQAVVFLYKIINIFDKDVTIQFVDVISPVILFVAGLILFFFLVYVLTKSKAMAIISSIFLAFIPSYLYRTMAGFSDHDSIGMMAFFATLLVYALALKHLEKSKENLKKKDLGKNVLYGLGLGFLSAFTIASWGGISAFIFMIIPISFGIFWLLKVKKIENVNNRYLTGIILFYALWIISSIFSGIIYGPTLQGMFNRIILGASNLLTGGVLLFIIIDYLFIKFGKKLGLNKEGKLEKRRLIYSLIAFVIAGMIFLWIFKGNPFVYIPELIDRLLHPFGTGRTSLTVAENKQPYLIDWINDIGKYFFWMFYLGIAFIGFEIAKKIGEKKDKVIFSLLWIVMISGILFSRISSSSLLNGANFISQLCYLGGLIIFLIYSIRLYSKKSIEINSSLLIIASWLIIVLISGRGAIRLFFAIIPFVCFAATFAIVKTGNYLKNSKDDLLKIVLFAVFILILIGSLISLNTFVAGSSQQAKYTSPSANYQWQNAMSWVRENTAKDSIFVHWWDYGYWVEYLGERAAVTDGGHAIGFWDHLIGRYVLTTPYPETALSFMKTHDVTHLLIDSTDMGKYGAYSKIGSDEEGNDRYSYIPTMVVDSSQTKEDKNSISRVYQGVASVDEDIIYNDSNGQIFLPKDNAYIIGMIIKTTSEGELSDSPIAVFTYNEQFIYIPMRYAYYDNNLIDFGGGLESVAYIVPIVTSVQPVQVDELSAVMYLSPLVYKGLFAQLYLMEDAFSNYSTVKLVHEEDDSLVEFLKNQGFNSDIVYYNGLRGPIKIWEVSYPSNILEREEFLRTSGEYAEFDNLNFTV